MRILLADDEKPLTEFLCRGLKSEGHDVLIENELHAVLPRLKQYIPDLLVLDRMFHDSDSVDILPHIKKLPSPPMVIMLTAMDEVGEKIRGLQEGADDYLTKPFDYDELLARITALSRRSNNYLKASANERLLSIGDLQISIEQRTAELNGSQLELTKIEFELLVFFVQQPNKLITRERILNRIWGVSSDPQTNIVDVYISRLRNKLNGSSCINIQTARGSGYRLVQS